MPPTFVDLPGGHWVPNPGLFPTASALGFTNLGNISTNTELVAFITRARKACTLDLVEFHLGNIATPQNLEVSFRNVNESGGSAGFVDGTADQYTIIASGSLVANGWNVAGLMTDDGTAGGVKRTVAKAELFGVTFRMTGAGDIMFRHATNDTFNNFPYTTYLQFLKNGRSFPIAIKCSDGTYLQLDPVTYPWTAFFQAGAFDTTTTPDEVGNVFTVGATHKVDGVWLKSNLISAYKVVLYDTDGTTVLTETEPQAADTIFVNAPWNQYLPYKAEVTLNAGSTYRRVIKPTTTTGGTGLYYGFEVANNALLGATEEGASCYMTERTDAGAWTNTTTKRILLGHRWRAIQTEPGTGGSGRAHARASFGISA
jgi:hypothetical protein